MKAGTLELLIIGMTTGLVIGYNVGRYVPHEQIDTAPAVEQPLPAPTPQPQAPLVLRPDPRGARVAHINGEEIELRFFVAPQPRLGQLDTSSGFFEREIEAARNGDDAITAWLWHQLQRCTVMPRTESELAEREEDTRKAYAITGGGSDALTEEQALAVWYDGYIHCRGTTPEMVDEVRELLGRSWARGNGTNGLLFAAALLQANDSGHARAVYRDLWEREGRWLALHGLGHQSLPHRLAYLALEIAWLDNRSEQPLNEAVERDRDELRRIEAQTSPPEFAAAQEQAAAILRNPRCCVL